MSHCACNNTDNWTEVEAWAKRVLAEPLVAYIEEARSKPHPEGELIGVLHKVQGHYGYLGRDQLDAVAQLLQVPTAKVTGVATFYHYFRLTPCGKNTIRICLGTACYVKGASRLVDKLKEELGIDFGETTKDGIFSLEASRCLGTCGLAPVLMINEDVHSKVTPDQIPGILERYMVRAIA
jgi:NADH-quinone oxidoreductase E subunit